MLLFFRALSLCLARVHTDSSVYDTSSISRSESVVHFGISSLIFFFLFFCLSFPLPVSYLSFSLRLILHLLHPLFVLPPRPSYTMPLDNCHQVCQSFNTHLARYPIVAVGLPLIGGFLTAVPAHRTVHDFYSTLKKPSWAAPACAFPPIWAALYVTVGYASHLVALRSGPNTLPSIRNLAHTGLGIYGLNLALNFAWSPLMFWKEKIGAALVTAGGLTVSPR